MRKLLLFLSAIVVSMMISAQDRPDPQPAADTYEKFKVGMAGYTFVNFDLDKTLQTLEKCDVHYLCIKDFHLPFNSTDKYGRLFKKYLNQEMWAKTEQTFSGSDIKENWTALFSMTDLVSEIGTELSKKLEYKYPDKLENDIRKYLAGLKPKT